MTYFENKLPPPLVALALAVLMWGLSQWLPPYPLEPAPKGVAIAFFSLIGLGVAGSAIRAFRRANTTINPVDIEQATRLVTTGVFRYTRNPMYIGLTSALASWALYLAVPWNLLGPVVFVIFIHRFQILPEERAMRAKFGAEYESYQNRVRRWI